MNSVVEQTVLLPNANIFIRSTTGITLMLANGSFSRPRCSWFVSRYLLDVFIIGANCRIRLFVWFLCNIRTRAFLISFFSDCNNLCCVFAVGSNLLCTGSMVRHRSWTLSGNKLLFLLRSIVSSSSCKCSFIEVHTEICSLFLKNCCLGILWSCQHFIRNGCYSYIYSKIKTNWNQLRVQE